MDVRWVISGAIHKMLALPNNRRFPLTDDLVNTYTKTDTVLSQQSLLHGNLTNKTPFLTRTPFRNIDECNYIYRRLQPRSLNL